MNMIDDECKGETFARLETAVDEDVVLLNISDDFHYIIKAMAEIDENWHPFVGLRVLAYANGLGWELDDKAISDIYSIGLIKAVTELQGRHCGDIYFHYENGSEERDVYDTAFDCMSYFSKGSNPTVLDVTNEEFKDIFNLLKPGDYLVHFR